MVLGVLAAVGLPCPIAAKAQVEPTRIPMPAQVRAAYASGSRDSSGKPGPRYWQVHNTYRIRAELDPVTSRVTGSATVVFRNASPSPVSSIVLRLDQNRFRAPTASPQDAPHATDGMTVTRLVVDGEAATIGTVQQDRPGLTGTLKTSERIALARPIVPNDSAVLDVDWHFEVPLDNSRGALRMGRWDNRVFQVAQWYPRIAMLDDLSGWDTTSYTGRLEFHNSFSRFDVELRVPSGWLVGATGVLQNPDDVLSARTRNRLAAALASDSIVTVARPDEPGATSTGRIQTWRFAADSVSDFAWGASPDYAWHAAGVSIQGPSRILVHLLFTSGDFEGVRRLADTLRLDLNFNSSLLTPYAFPQLTLIGGPEGGMEYPMLIMSDGLPSAHEIWHQWFPMTVGSNETLYAFLDEGFASFLAGVTTVGRDRRTYVPRARARRSDTPLIPPDDQVSTESLAALAAMSGYVRPTAMFGALIDLVGHDQMFKALKEYAATWSFRHPSPWDFMFSMSRSLGRNLDAFWYRWLFSVN